MAMADDFVEYISCARMIYKKYLFKRNFKKGDTVYWVCSQRLEMGCCASMVTKSANYFRMKGKHYHDPVPIPKEELYKMQNKNYKN